MHGTVSLKTVDKNLDKGRVELPTICLPGATENFGLLLTVENIRKPASYCFQCGGTGW